MSVLRYYRVVRGHAGTVTVGVTTDELIAVLLASPGVVTVHESLRAALGGDADWTDS